jgi:hypothetical protein
VAAYQSLSGIDVFYWFSTGEAEWSSQDRAPWDSASRSKWSIATPMILGQFPATALLFRKGYLAQGRPVVDEHRSLRQLWERTRPVLVEDPGYDPNRDAGDVARRSDRLGAADPLAFLVGPVKVHYDSNPAETKVADLRRFIDAGRQIITSNTGEIRFDYGRGLCVIDASCAQGSCGFLKKAGSIELSAVAISSTNDYASVLVVSQDGAPLTKCRQVLVQVGTRARPADWVEREATFTADDGKQTFHGKQVVSTGRMPWAIDETRVSLFIRNPSLKRATLLDVNGNPRGPVGAQATGTGVKLSLPRDAMYVSVSAL